MNVKNKKETELDFLTSALSYGEAESTQNILSWLQKNNENIISRIKEIPISQLKGWEYEKEKISHNSGKFFSIDGIRVHTNYGLVSTWDQPIINQPEIGFLGFIVKNINGILHFLLQAKIEPGNLNIVQLSPTLQATRSNYTRVHKGKTPLYLEYFNGDKSVKILIDQLQSEQGARFLHKRNRNIIVEVEESEITQIQENFIWATLGQIKKLLYYPNVINMDTRTVISCIQFGDYSKTNIDLLFAFKNIENSSRTSSYIYSILSNENHLHEIKYILHWITSLKFKYELDLKTIPLAEVKEWICDNESIRHKTGKYFSVIGVDVNIGNREVISWCQPMIKSVQEGIIGFLVKKINGIYHFLVQGKLESGNFDIIELAPTVQCLTGNYRQEENEYAVPYINEFINTDKSKFWFSTYQSEEGGRFFQEQNLNIIKEVDDDFPNETLENYCWMTLNQLTKFVQFNNYLNISARSLLSAINFI